MFIQGKIWGTNGPDPLAESVGSWLDKVITEAVEDYMNNGFFNMGDGKVFFQCAETICHECSTDLSKLITEWGIDLYINNNTGKIEVKEDIAQAKRLRGILLNAVEKIDLALET